jgi:ParB-like chromosome segregation protein Spo0J
MKGCVGMEYHCKHDALVDPKTLKDHPKNVNRHPKEQLDALINFIRFSGWRHPVVVSNLSGCIVAGHARKLAAIELTCDAPVVYQDFDTDEAERTFLHADNNLSELSEIDIEELTMEVVDLESAGIPVLDFGFELDKDLPSDDDNDDPGKLQEILIVEVTCKNELEQSEVFNLLKQHGYNAKIMGI